jgi:hypothetical protein
LSLPCLSGFCSGSLGEPLPYKLSKQRSLLMLSDNL